jgi:hypothetical protein
MIRWRLFYIGFFLYRCACTIAGELVVVRLTSLGDARRFQGHFKKFTGLSGDFHWLLDSTQILEAFGMMLSSFMPRQYLAMSLIYQTIAFVGLVIFLNSIAPRIRIFAAILLLSPSFNIWSSVASKEAFIVFSVSIICSHIISAYNNDFRLRYLYLISGYILAVFKPHYFASLLFIYTGIVLSKFIKQKEALILLMGGVSLSFLYFFRDTIDRLSFQMLPHFLTDAGRSTRLGYWQEPYDAFIKAPMGMLLSFVGPTFEEALKNTLQMVSLMESGFILLILLLIFLARRDRIPAFAFMLVLFGIFWLLFANYPFGVMNPGSAIRYRAGYYVIIVMAFVVLLSRQAHTNWLTDRDSRELRRKTPSRWRLSPRIVMRHKVKFQWGRKT